MPFSDSCQGLLVDAAGGVEQNPAAFYIGSPNKRRGTDTKLRRARAILPMISVLDE
jgi:hypothetical protein